MSCCCHDCLCTDPDLLYNADETGLFYRLLPEQTLASKTTEDHAKGFKHCKERLTVLVTVNSTGTHKLKLLTIGKSQRPRCFRGKDAGTMPSYWKANKTAWMTTDIFTWWLQHCFVPEVKAFKVRMGKPINAPVRLSSMLPPMCAACMPQITCTPSLTLPLMLVPCRPS